jgi:ATP-dependent RNA helicase SUPV3L1/SUV3
VGAHSVWLPGVLKPRGRVMGQAFAATEPFRAGGSGLTLLAIPAPSVRALSAFGRRAVGRWSVPVELLETLAEAKQAAGKGNIPDTVLTELGLKAGEAGALLAALKTPRAQQPDRPGKPVVIKDSPFAKLAELAAAPAPARRKRPRRKKAANTSGRSRPEA